MKKAPGNNSSIVLKRKHHRENNELSELFVLVYKEREVHALVEALMPHAIQIRQTRGLEVLIRTPIEVGEPGPGQSAPFAQGVEGAHEALEARATSGSTILTTQPSVHRSLS